MDPHLESAPESRASPSGGATHLLVRSGEVTCALPLGAVRRVVRALAVYPLPGATPALLGLAELAGEPLAVLDLGRLVAAPPGGHPAFPVTVVVRTGAGSDAELVGLQADEALEVVAVPREAIVAAGRGFVAGEATLRELAVRVLDPAALGAAG